jgi:hypothetical protein
VVFGAVARVPVEVKNLDRQTVVAKKLGELLDVNGLARERGGRSRPELRG